MRQILWKSFHEILVGRAPQLALHLACSLIALRAEQQLIHGSEILRISSAGSSWDVDGEVKGATAQCRQGRATLMRRGASLLRCAGMLLQPLILSSHSLSLMAVDHARLLACLFAWLKGDTQALEHLTARLPPALQPRTDAV